MDYIQSATGLKVRPQSLSCGIHEGDGIREKEKKISQNRNSLWETSDLDHSVHTHIAHTTLHNALQSYQQSLLAAQSLSTDPISTKLIEEEFVYALSQYCSWFDCCGGLMCSVALKDGRELMIRPILPSDIDRMKEGMCRLRMPL